MMAQVEEWLELESDPGLFTMLIENIGVKGVQVEDIYDVTEDIKEEIFGFVFLFKWHEDHRKPKRTQNSDQNKSNMAATDSKNVDYEINPEKLKDIYFAHQVIPNSCATNALLSVLMNCHDKIQIGPILTKFRDMTINLSPDKRGAALGEMPELADAHNKRARYFKNDHSGANINHQSPYHSLTASVGSPNARGLFSDSGHDSNETYHFVSYVPVGNNLYELDGLQPYPIKHGTLITGTSEEWTRKCLELIRSRMRQQTSEHYSLMAVVRDRRRVLAEQLSILNTNRAVLQQALMQLDTVGSSGAECSNHVTGAAISAVNAVAAAVTESSQLMSDMAASTGLVNVSISGSGNGTPNVAIGRDGPEASSSNSDESQKNSGSRKRRISARVSLRNLKKAEKRCITSNNSSIEEMTSLRLQESGSAQGITTTVKCEETEDMMSPPVDVLRPISIDITSSMQGSVSSTEMSSNSCQLLEGSGTATASSSITPDPSTVFSVTVLNSNNGNNNSKYPTRSSTKRDTAASNSLASARMQSNIGTNSNNLSEDNSLFTSQPPFSPSQIRRLLQIVEDSIKSCKSRMSDEIEKHNKYVTDDVRRSFNYDDFIHAFLFALKKQGLLEKLLEEQRSNLLHNYASSSRSNKRAGYRSSTACKRMKMVSSQNNTGNNGISSTKEECGDNNSTNINISKKFSKKSLRSRKPKK